MDPRAGGSLNKKKKKKKREFPKRWWWNRLVSNILIRFSGFNVGLEEQIETHTHPYIYSMGINIQKIENQIVSSPK